MRCGADRGRNREADRSDRRDLGINPAPWELGRQDRAAVRAPTVSRRATSLSQKRLRSENADLRMERDVLSDPWSCEGGDEVKRGTLHRRPGDLRPSAGEDAASRCGDRPKVAAPGGPPRVETGTSRSWPPLPSAMNPAFVDPQVLHPQTQDFTAAEPAERHRCDSSGWC